VVVVVGAQVVGVVGAMVVVVTGGSDVAEAPLEVVTAESAVVAEQDTNRKQMTATCVVTRYDIECDFGRSSLQVLEM
jgi:hypothetical protein